MTDRTILKRITAGEQAGLEAAIGKYGGYVSAIIRRRGRDFIQPEDVEELCADVFLALWQNAPNLHSDRLKQWLGAVARNKAVEQLRRWKQTVPLDDSYLLIDDGLWDTMQQKQREALVASALRSLDPVTAQIMQRFYQLCQTTREIAEEMHINESTVRSRLSRGRTKMKQYLQKRGICYEDIL